MDVTREQLASLDPSETAPPLVVENVPAMDTPGHGWNLPLIGNERPHTFDVVYDCERHRIYADTMSGVLGALIPEYSTVAQRLEDALRADDADSVEAALTECFRLRHAHADNVRIELQTTIVEDARRTGEWDSLDEEEREQLDSSVAGHVPVGVVFEVPMEDTEGTPYTDLQGFWSHPRVRLVVNRGDYGLFDPDGTPEPESDLSEIDPTTGRHIVFGGRYPANMVILDPTSEESLIETLQRANVIRVIPRPVDLPDEVYLSAMDAGRHVTPDEGSQ